MLYFHRRRTQGHPAVAAFLAIVIGALVAGGGLLSHRVGQASSLERILPFALGVLGATLALGVIVVRAARGGFEAPERGTSRGTDEWRQRRVFKLIALAILVGLLVVLGIVKEARAQEPVRGGAAAEPMRGAFVFLAGADTVGVERFTLAFSSLSGEILMRGQPRLAYDIPVNADTAAGPVSLVIFAANAAPDAAPLGRAVVTVRGDSVIVESRGASGQANVQRLLTTRGAIPVIPQSGAMFELVWRRARAGDGTLSPVPIFLTAGGQTLPVTFTRITGDSLRMQVGPQESYAVLDRDGHLLRVHVPGQRLSMIRVDGEAAKRIALGRPDYSAPADAPYTATDVEIRTPQGHVLAATLTLPKAAGGRVPVVVTITGSGPQDRDEYIPIVPGYRLFRQVADTLGRRGIAVLRYDERGAGLSTGNYAAATSRDFADDVKTIVAWLRERPEIDPARIAIAGHSEGGIVGPMVAAEDPRIAALVVMAGPSQPLSRVIEYQIRYGIDHDTSIAAAKKDSTYRAIKTQFDTTTARTPWFRWVLPYDPLPTARKVKQPVLILHGATDRQVTEDQAAALAAAFRQGGNRDVVVKVLPDRNHLFLVDPDGSPAGYVRLTNSRVGPETLGPLADWLAEKLKVAAAK